jgi:pyruvate/2-oxoglutarate dehydrogenase complex dihydrolipoamide dehydrogenase (E3) component
MKHFKHLIIGTGQATGVLLGKLIPTKTAIGVIEADKVGGTCLNYGCTPTKTLVATAKAFHQAKRGDFYGFHAENLNLDYAKVRARMNGIRNSGNSGLTSWMNHTPNVDLMFGRAKFTAEKQVEVNGQVCTADNIYINVGTRPSAPPIPGIDDINWLDSAGLLDLENVPEHLIIIGGGYIGVEFAQVFRRFGAKVSIIQRGAQLVPREDEDVAMAIKEFLEEEEIDIYCNANTINIAQKDAHKEVAVEVNGETKLLSGDQVLIAAGRIPNSDTLDLENTGIKTNAQGYIDVDNYCETAVEGVYAVGDVNGHGGFTHTAVNDGEIVLDKLFGGDRTLDGRNFIYGLFTDPPLGRIGMTEKEAIKSGKKVLKATRPMSKISRAKEMGETKGFAKILVDAETDLILGASILGVGGDEIINMFATIMHSKIPCRHYRKVVLVHPTVSELMPWILDGIKEVKEKKTI